MDRLTPLPAGGAPSSQPKMPLNYSDILRELQQEQQNQAPPPPTATEPPPQAVAPPPPPPPPPPPILKPLVEPPVKVPTPVVVPQASSPSSFAMYMARYRRHIFVALLAFTFMHYGAPFLKQISSLSGSRVMYNMAIAISLGVLYYLSDVLILTPQVIVVDQA